MYINIIYFIISVISTLLVFKLLINNGSYLNLYDYPDERKIHKEKILKIGGIGIIFSSLLILLVYRIVSEEILLSIAESESQILFSTTFLILGGFFDDLIDISAYQKLFFQLIAIFIVTKSGFVFSLSSYYYLDLIISMIFFIVVINSMNLIDGIDGLSSGIFIIFCLNMIIVVSLIPFLLVNGILTGSFNNPVVLYNSSAIINVRLLNIPLEDFFYCFSMLALTLLPYNYFKKRL